MPHCGGDPDDPADPVPRPACDGEQVGEGFGDVFPRLPLELYETPGEVLITSFDTPTETA